MSVCLSVCLSVTILVTPVLYFLLRPAGFVACVRLRLFEMRMRPAWAGGGTIVLQGRSTKHTSCIGRPRRRLL